MSFQPMSRCSDFDKLRTALHKLTLRQAKQLHAELNAIVHALEQQVTTLEAIETKGHEVVETTRMDDRLYQLERVRCGKMGCKCAGENGELHGPYWYVYWRDNGKLKSRYVGKRLRKIE